MAEIREIFETALFRNEDRPLEKVEADGIEYRIPRGNPYILARLRTRVNLNSVEYDSGDPFYVAFHHVPQKVKWKTNNGAGRVAGDEIMSLHCFAFMRKLREMLSPLAFPDDAPLPLEVTPLVIAGDTNTIPSSSYFWYLHPESIRPEVELEGGSFSKAKFNALPAAHLIRLLM